MKQEEEMKFLASLRKTMRGTRDHVLIWQNEEERKIPCKACHENETEMERLHSLGGRQSILAKN